MNRKVGNEADLKQTAEWKQALQEATAPSTTPAQLTELVHIYPMGDSRASALHRRICAHPNTPPEILLQFLARYPAAFCRNPITPFLSLEMPDIVDRIPDFAGIRLMARANLPTVYIRSFGQRENIRVHPAWERHFRISGDLAPDDETWREMLQKELTTRTHQDPWQISELLDLGIVPGWARTLLAGHQSALMEPRPPDLANSLAMLEGWVIDAVRNGSPEIRRRAELAMEAANPDTPMDRLQELAASPVQEVMAALAHNPVASPEVLRVLWERGAVVPPQVTVWPGGLFGQRPGDTALRHTLALAIAQHPRSPADLLSRVYAEDGGALARAALAARRDTPPAILERLAGDKRLVRHALSQHLYARRARLQSRLRATAIQEALELRPELGDSLTSRHLVIGFARLPLQELYHSLCEGNWLERILAARNPYLSDSLRRRLREEEGDRLIRAAFLAPRDE